MLPIVQDVGILEDHEEMIENSRPTIFKTIVNEGTPIGSFLTTPNLFPRQPKDTIYSNKSKGNYTDSTAIETNRNSNNDIEKGNVGPINCISTSRNFLKSKLAIFCVDEHEEEAELKEDKQQQRLIKSLNNSTESNGNTSSNSTSSLNNKSRDHGISNSSNKNDRKNFGSKTRKVTNYSLFSDQKAKLCSFLPQNLTTTDDEKVLDYD